MTTERYLGVMVGTSLDGIDLALVAVRDGCPDLEDFRHLAFSTEERDTLHAFVGAETHAMGRVLALHQVLGKRIGTAARAWMAEIGLAPQTVAAIGCHGPTLFHQPDPLPVWGDSGRGTMQLGDPYQVRLATGVPVIFDFRHADMALDGQGAPLAPFADDLWFRHPGKGRILLNLGGIANLTMLPADRERILAFDTGPANMISDALMRRHPHSPAAFDAAGRCAARGKAVPELVAECLEHPYFSRKPPKSTGRELFGETFLAKFLDYRPAPKSYEDLVASAVRLSAESVAGAIRSLAAGPFALEHYCELVVSGGGAHNPVLMGWLVELLPELAVTTTGALGLDGDAKEAALMAALAWAHCHRIPANFPSVTGASARTVLGVRVD